MIGLLPAAAVLAALLVAIACGWVLARAVAAHLSRGERAAWAAALGLLLLAGASGALVAFGLVPGPKKLGAIALAVLGAAALARRRDRLAPLPLRPRATPAAILLGVAALLAAAFFAVTAVRTGLYGTDALAIWMLKARTIFETGRIPARLFSDPALALSHPGYPMLVPLTVASAAMAARAWDPRALALVYVVWQLATIAAVAGVLSRRCSRAAGAAGALLAALCGALWTATSVGTAEIPLALGVVLAGTAFLDWLDRPSAPVLLRLLLGAAMCAGAKPEGIVFCAILAACLVFRRGARLRLAGAAALLVPAAASFWISRALVRGVPHAGFDASLLAPARWPELLPRLREVLVHLVSAEVADAWPLAAGVALVLLVGAASVADALILPLVLQAGWYSVVSAASADPIAGIGPLAGRAAALWPAAVIVLVSRAAGALETRRREPGRALGPALAGAALALAVLVPIALGRSLRAAGPVTVAGLARPTFHATVEPILQARCQGCHHAGGIAPIALVRYGETLEHAAQVAAMVESRRMPPWKASAGPHPFANDPTLTWAEREALVRWARRGAPEGRPSDAPPPRTFSDGWALGPPDLVLKAPRFTPDFSKGDLYQCFVLPTNLDADAWVSAVEVRPGNAAMMHHALLYVEEGATSLELDETAPGPGYPCFGGPRAPVTDSFGEWAPGMQPRRYPPGVARFLPRKSRIVMQVHYSALFGDVKPDESEVGVYFAKDPVTRRLLSNDVRSYAPFTLAAGDPAAGLWGSFGPLSSRAELVAILPHMHLLGRTMTVTARMPDGSRQKLVDVNDWDLRWQRTYYFEKPVVLPAGTFLELSASFDNSLANPRNPTDPPKDVHFGEMTTDEMCMALLFWTVDGKNPGEKNAFFRGEVCSPEKGPLRSGVPSRQ
ncbi:MAG TPA: hypothetical protein VH854_04440 [Thermoanaerobaculia bacterium]|nr:hypothetical protein [Thermoanaerobaculia bacterium]